MMPTTTLYHGTTPENAEILLSEGWTPSSGHGGGNCGQTRYLYLSTAYEDALWFANEKGYDTVLTLVDVPLHLLEVDPEDGTYDTVEEELEEKGGLPGKIVLKGPLSADHFSHQTTPSPTNQAPSP